MPLIADELYPLVDEVRAANAETARRLADFRESISVPPDSPAYLAAMRGIMDDPAGPFFEPRVESAQELTIEGPGGELALRILRPADPSRIKAVYLSMHGGGWVMGNRASHDQANWRLVQACDIAVVSPEYRLAPENVYPAANDDCEAAALWLLDNAAEQFATTTIVIGGGSAGAHLAACTLLRLRDRHDASDAVAGALFDCGMYDVTGTPSVVRPTPENSTLDLRGKTHPYFRGTPTDALRHPDISPLYADLSNLCPALFVAGTNDPLLDDSLFMAARWEVAGNRTELTVYPEGPHGIALSPTLMGEHARSRRTTFLQSIVG